MDAAYLHARYPADARVVFYDVAGIEAVRAALPPELREVAEARDFEILLPTEESGLRPLLRSEARDSETSERIVPAMWRVPGLALPLATAVPYLAGAAAAPAPAGVRFLGAAARLTVALLRNGDFARARPDHKLLHFVPVWRQPTIDCLRGVALLSPESLQTARVPAHEDPVYAVTYRNLAVSFVGHALDVLAGDYPLPEPPPTPEPLPRDFWHHDLCPVLEIHVPERELEEGVPFAIVLTFRTAPDVSVELTLEQLAERDRSRLFPDLHDREALRRARIRLENVAARIGVVRRAMNMVDGRASLSRAELDGVLDHLPLLESEGFTMRVPGQEAAQRIAARVNLVEVPGGGDRPWFEFQWSVALGDRTLSKAEFDRLVESTSPLVLIGSRPVLIAPKDREALQRFKRREGTEGRKVSFFEALRLRLGGATHLHGLSLESVGSTPRLDALIDNLEQARTIEMRPHPAGFEGELRPYQQRGHSWAYYLADQGFGMCLADDMGLGKTVQAIALVLDWCRQKGRSGSVLVVCPVSVLGNWRRELQRFAPAMRVCLHHGKGRAASADEYATVLRDHDAVLTSYNLLQRDSEILHSAEYQGVILDEAQNVKNPTTRQAKAARGLRSAFRIALTGTPLENRPLDLWSIMDILNEGLLGSRTQFVQTLEHPIVKQRSRSQMGVLARLVRPFVLRRLKTDPEIVNDLPEKSEQVVNATLTREQATLYEGLVRRGLDELENAEGIQRRGAILTTLLRLKQICNHPAHYLGDGSALAARSGKLDLLTEMLQEAIEEGDRCLVFTQFKEMGVLLRTHLEAVLQSKVLFLHGGVPQKERESMVAEFQAAEEDGPRVFVLSLKAGGTGLNLTAANRVFHFDRWWNPAVEDQATDRAFRIGQQRNVFVHKFVCVGTLEERIQTMLERKRQVAGDLLGAGESWLTELSNDELHRLLTLDRAEALA
ncbi:MAG: SNF2-related protein [Planctomycetota bacterium]